MEVDIWVKELSIEPIEQFSAALGDISIS